MSIYAEKYAICALCYNMRKMRQRAKYAVPAYSHKTEMPNYTAVMLSDNESCVRARQSLLQVLTVLCAVESGNMLFIVV